MATALPGMDAPTADQLNMLQSITLDIRTAIKMLDLEPNAFLSTPRNPPGLITPTLTTAPTVKTTLLPAPPSWFKRVASFPGATTVAGEPDSDQFVDSPTDRQVEIQYIRYVCKDLSASRRCICVHRRRPTEHLRFAPLHLLQAL